MCSLWEYIFKFSAKMKNIFLETQQIIRLPSKETSEELLQQLIQKKIDQIEFSQKNHIYQGCLISGNKKFDDLVHSSLRNINLKRI